MNARSTLAAAAATAAVLASTGITLADGAAQSGSVTVYTATNTALCWVTYNTGVSPGIALDWPAAATSATLNFNGMGENKTVTLTDKTLVRYAPDMPKNRDEERVYTLTLKFLKDAAVLNTETASVAFVQGAGQHQATRFVGTVTDKKWQNIESKTAVLPLVPAATSLTVVGADPLTATVDGGFGWYGWYPVGMKQNTLTLALSDSSSLTAVVNRSTRGTVVMLR